MCALSQVNFNRLVLREQRPPTSRPAPSTYQLLDELAFYFGPDGYCNRKAFNSSDLLLFVTRLERRFASNTALQEALGVISRPVDVHGPDLRNQTLRAASGREADAMADNCGDGAGSDGEEYEVQDDGDGEEEDIVLEGEMQDVNWKGDRAL